MEIGGVWKFCWIIFVFEGHWRLSRLTPPPLAVSFYLKPTASASITQLARMKHTKDWWVCGMLSCLNAFGLVLSKVRLSILLKSRSSWWFQAFPKRCSVNWDRLSQKGFKRKKVNESTTQLLSQRPRRRQRLCRGFRPTSHPSAWFPSRCVPPPSSPRGWS